MSDTFADFRRQPSVPHQCMYHNDQDGRQCRARSMLNQYMCFAHRTNTVPPVIENDPFEIVHLDTREAIQQALGDVAARLASNRMDLKRAGLLVYTLQLASSNLRTASGEWLNPQTTDSLPSHSPDQSPSAELSECEHEVAA